MGQAGTKWGKRMLIFGKVLSHEGGIKVLGNITFKDFRSLENLSLMSFLTLSIMSFRTSVARRNLLRRAFLLCIVCSLSRKSFLSIVRNDKAFYFSSQYLWL